MLGKETLNNLFGNNIDLVDYTEDYKLVTELLDEIKDLLRSRTVPGKLTSTCSLKFCMLRGCFSCAT